MSWLAVVPIVLLLPLGCGGGNRTAPAPVDAAPFEVVRVTPADALAQDRPVLLNERLTVYFSDPIDPYTVHDASFRVVDDAGHAVRGRIIAHKHSVSFVPVPPLRAELDDGSFAPARSYHLEVSGFPSAGGIRAEDGRLLDRGRRFAFRTVDRDPGSTWPSPLLPVALEGEPFTVVQPPHPGRIAVGAGKLLIAFTLPVLPSSAVPEALSVYVITDGPPVEGGLQRRTLPIEAMRLLTRPEPVDPHPGCGLEVQLAPGHGLQPGDTVIAEVSPDRPLLDYAGRALQLDLPGAASSVDAPPQRYLPTLWTVVDGDRLVLDERPSASERGAHLRSATGGPGLEVDETGRIVPQVFVEAGAGVWDFEPTADLVIEPGVPLPRDALHLGEEVEVSPAMPGSVSPAAAVWEFRSIRIPAGRTVTIRSAQPVEWRVQGRVAIEGTLRLETPATTAGTSLPIGRGAAVRDVGGIGFRLIAAGDVFLPGALEHRDAPVPGQPPAALITEGEFRIPGRLAPHTALFGDVVQGRQLDMVTVDKLALTRGLPAGAGYLCEGWTPWLRVPTDQVQGTAVRLLGATDGVSVAVQRAAPDAVTQGAPREGASGMEQPRPIRGELELEPGPGSFLRFRIRARVVHGQPMPTLDRIQLLAGS